MPKKPKSHAPTARQPKMWSATAMPGAGKTDILIDLVNRKLKASTRALIVDPDGAEQKWDRFKRIEGGITQLDPKFTGAVVIDYDEKAKGVEGTFEFLWNKLIKPGKLKNFTLVLDDPNVYAKDKLIPELTNLLRRKRQHNYEILTTAHSWGETPKSFLRFIDIFLLGPTATGPEDRKDILGPAKTAKHLQWKAKADAEARAAKAAGRKHRFFAFDKDGESL